MIWAGTKLLLFFIYESHHEVSCVIFEPCQEVSCVIYESSHEVSCECRPLCLMMLRSVSHATWAPMSCLCYFNSSSMLKQDTGQKTLAHIHKWDNSRHECSKSTDPVSILWGLLDIWWLFHIFYRQIRGWCMVLFPYVFRPIRHLLDIWCYFHIFIDQSVS